MGMWPFMLEKRHKKMEKGISFLRNGIKPGAAQQLMLQDVCEQHNWVYDDRLMRLSSSAHANGAIKEIADKGLQLNLVSNNRWQRKDAAHYEGRGLGGARWGSVGLPWGAGVAAWS